MFNSSSAELTARIIVIHLKLDLLTQTQLNITKLFQQIWVIFTRLKLWVAVATHNFKRVKIKFR